jgi:invasion protein IalB
METILNNLARFRAGHPLPCLGLFVAILGLTFGSLVFQASPVLAAPAKSPAAAAEQTKAPAAAAPADAAPADAAATADAAAPADPSAPVVVSGTDTVLQPWTVNCTSQGDAAVLNCAMSQVLLAKQTGQRVVGATVFRPKPDAAAVMRVSLPHGVLLPEGVDVGIDDAAPTKHVISIADQNGSYAQFELGGSMIGELQGGTSLSIGVSAADGKRIVFKLSLKGFGAAFAKI